MTTQTPLTTVTTSQTLSTTQSTITSSVTITTTQNPTTTTVTQTFSTTITQTTITTTQNPTSTMTTQTLSTTVTNTMTTTQNPTTTTITQTLSTTVTNTMTTTQNPTTTTINQTLSTTVTTTTQNLTNTTTTTQSIINNYYVQFSFPLNISDGDNITDDELTTELTSIFINALGISSNQISITISTSKSGSRAVMVQVRFFSTASVSADNLLLSTQTQLANPNSQLRQAPLTSQLNQNSIANIGQYYTCSNGVVQESPCTTSTTSATSQSGTSLSTILLASIIPSVFVFVLLIVVAFFLIRYVRSPSFRPRPSRFDRF
jgi:hypothetical protein